jgi:1,4-dihydroxy-2-naphthoate octaprenyltransferase
LSTAKIWLKAARLRTLPLAAGGILLGSFLAAYEYSFSWPVFLLAFFTAVLLQILSNLANDYGDYQKGTDQAAERNDRALASGAISLKAMKNALWIVGLATLFCGLGLLFAAFQKLDFKFLVWLSIGLAAIAAAMKYTVGKSAYGYRGLGDLFVLLFFGPVAVGGTYMLMTGQLHENIFVASIGFGLLCVAVLNINNLRDIESDKAAGKKTMAVRLGFKKTIWYQYGLFGSAILLFILFARVSVSPYDHFLPIAIGTAYYLITFKLSKQPAGRDPYHQALKQVSLLNLLFVILLGIFWLA